MNRKLGFVAAVLAFMVLVAGNSDKRTTVSLDPHRLAYIIQHELDHVSAYDLGKSLMEGHSTYCILDLRDSVEYSKHHIPGAQNIALTALIDADFQKNEPIVLCSEGGVHSAQAMFLLWSKGYSHVYMLKGGMNEWNEEVLHPAISTVPGDELETDSVATLRKMRVFFGVGVGGILPKIEQQSKQNGEREKLRNEC